METIKVNMTPNPLDVQTIHASQNDGEARQWEFELHNNGELIDTSDITEQLFFKSYKGGTEQILPENTSTPTTSPFKGDIRYPQGLLSDQEFTYRQSPTEEDGLAKITDIKGNTLVWNQLVKNGNFADGTNNWTSGTSGSTISVANGELTVTINGAWNNDARQSISLIANHKYLGCFSVKGSVGVEVKMQQFGSSDDVNICKSVTLTTSYQRVIGIATPSQSSVGLRTTIESNASSYTGQTYTIKDVMFIDLTQMGLDISSPSEFTSLFPKSYYDYCKGAMLSFGGRNVKFNQLLRNGNFADTSVWSPTSGLTFTVSNNVASVVCNTEGDRYVQQDVPMVIGHKYLVSADCKTSTTGNGVFYIFFGASSNNRYFYLDSSQGWQHYSTVVTCESNQYNMVRMVNRMVGATSQYKNIMVIDLTEMFGVGEPSAEGFKELFPNGYYEYTTGQYMNLGQPVSLKTVGKNLFDFSQFANGTITFENGVLTGTAGQLYTAYSNVVNKGIELKYPKNTQITISFDAITEQNESSWGNGLYLYSSENGIAKQIAATANSRTTIQHITLTIPSNRHIDKLGWSYGLAANNIWHITNFQVEFGTETSYEPYTESTLSIPLDEFPDGMDGINDTRDYKNETEYAKKIGRVDLGTLNWSYVANDRRFIAIISDAKSSSSLTVLENIVSAKYENATWENILTKAKDKIISLHYTSNNSYVAVIDNDYSSASTFKSAMNGVYLYYELATPLENYGVVDLGSLNFSYLGNKYFDATVSDIKQYETSVLPNIVCNKYPIYIANFSAATTYGITSFNGVVRIVDPSYTDATAFKQAVSGVYLLYEKENPQGFTTASLVTENAEIPLSNDDGVLIGKCTEELSAEPGFHDAKIKLADSDGECYSNKLQLHVERSPQ